MTLSPHLPSFYTLLVDVIELLSPYPMSLVEASPEESGKGRRTRNGVGTCVRAGGIAAVFSPLVGGAKQRFVTISPSARRTLPGLLHSGCGLQTWLKPGPLLGVGSPQVASGPKDDGRPCSAGTCSPWTTW